MFILKRKYLGHTHGTKKLKTIDLTNEHFQSEKSFNIFILQKGLNHKSHSSFDQQYMGNFCSEIGSKFQEISHIVFR